MKKAFPISISLNTILNGIPKENIQSGTQIRVQDLNLRVYNNIGKGKDNFIDYPHLEQLFIEAGFLLIKPCDDIIIPVCPIELLLYKNKKKSYILLVQEEFMKHIIGKDGIFIKKLNNYHNMQFKVKELNNDRRNFKKSNVLIERIKRVKDCINSLKTTGIDPGNIELHSGNHILNLSSSIKTKIQQDTIKYLNMELVELELEFKEITC